MGIARYVLNTALVSLGTVAGTVVLATLGGYGFARFRFPRRLGAIDWGVLEAGVVIT